MPSALQRIIIASRHPAQPPRWIEGLAIVVFWTLLGAIALVRRALNPTASFSLHTVAVTAVEYGPWLVLTPAVFWLTQRLPLERRQWMRRLLLHLVIAGTVTLALGTLHQWAIPALGPPKMGTAIAQRPPSQEPPRRPPGSDQRPPRARPSSSGGPPLALPSLHFAFYLFVMGMGFARAYAIQIQARQVEAEQLAAETLRLDAERAQLAAQLTEAHLGALRMQLNPHFLFNALNAVSALADSDPAAVRQIIARLSTLLRRVLDTEAAQEVPLREELAFLRDYLDVQRVRFEEGLDVEEDIAADTLDALVPNLILQPLIENAVEHGVGKRKSGQGQITLCARREHKMDGADDLVVTITDNGPGVPPQTAPRSRSKGIGLANIRERLAAHYGDAGILTLKPADPGVSAEIRLPFHIATTDTRPDTTYA